MAFTNDLATDYGKIRLELGDDTEFDGVRVNDVNFTDAQIQYALDQEGGHLMKATARLCEMLAREWSKEPTSYRIGPESTKIMTAEYWQAQANRLRNTYGANEIKIPLYQTGSAGISIYPAGANPADE